MNTHYKLIVLILSGYSHERFLIEAIRLNFTMFFQA